MKDFLFRDAVAEDAPRLSVLFSYVYIQAYAVEGVSQEYCNYIHKQFAISRITDTIQTSPGNIKLAAYNDHLVGVIELVFDSACPVGNIVCPEINKLYVMSNFSGKGIGKKLLNMAERFLISRGEIESWLWVWLPNQKAIQFYEREGYQSIGQAFFEMDSNTYENKVMYKKLV